MLAQVVGREPTPKTMSGGPHPVACQARPFPDSHRRNRARRLDPRKHEYNPPLAMESAMRRARSGNLTALLVAVSLLEFLVNRLAGRLFFPRPALTSGGSGSHTTHAVSVGGPFLFQLTAFLALAVMVAAFAGLFRRGELYPRAMRFSTIVIALFFAACQRLGDGQRPHPAAAFPLPRGLLRVPGNADRDRVPRCRRHPLRRQDRGRACSRCRARCTRSASCPRACAPGRSRPGGGDPTGAVAGRRRRWCARARSRCCSRGSLAPLLLPPRPFRERRWRFPLARRRRAHRGLRVRAGGALRPDAGERALRTAARAAAAGVERGRRARAGLLRLDVRDHRS